MGRPIRRVGEVPVTVTSSYPKKGCPGCTRAGWKVFMQVFALVIALCAIIVVAISVFVGANSNSIQRYNIYATSDQVSLSFFKKTFNLYIFSSKRFCQVQEST